MDSTIGQTTVDQASEATQPRWRPLTIFAVIVAVLAALALGFQLWPVLRGSTPGDSSAEAGFARDMAIHHTQAVEMALIVQERTEDPDIRILATDIVLTQQGQIGQMRGWLDAWGVPPNSSEPQMAWMGHPVEGRMPGMASPEEITQLRELPVAEMERLFLELMIVHHVAGVEMAQAILDQSDNETVEFLANAILASQQKEIDVMNDMLERMGHDRVPVEQMMDGDEQHHD